MHRREFSMLSQNLCIFAPLAETRCSRETRLYLANANLGRSYVDLISEVTVKFATGIVSMQM
jgi:hypothetical protein